jgi:hypothetical protein
MEPAQTPGAPPISARSIAPPGFPAEQRDAPQAQPAEPARPRRGTEAPPAPTFWGAVRAGRRAPAKASPSWQVIDSGERQLLLALVFIGAGCIAASAFLPLVDAGAVAQNSLIQTHSDSLGWWLVILAISLVTSTVRASQGGTKGWAPMLSLFGAGGVLVFVWLDHSFRTVTTSAGSYQAALGSALYVGGAGFILALTGLERLDKTAAKLVRAPQSRTVSRANPVQSTASPASDLQRLSDLHARGDLSDDEFAAAKAKLLA